MRVKRLAALLVAAILLAMIPLSASAQTGSTRRVRFQKGRSTAVLKGAVVRGTEDRFILGASRGQTMTVRVTSVEDNAYFEIFAPNSGRSMGSGEAEWSGELPRNGDYTIVISPTRGNATYTLEITIR